MSKKKRHHSPNYKAMQHITSGPVTHVLNEMIKQASKVVCACVCHLNASGTIAPHPGQKCLCNGGSGFSDTIEPVPVRPHFTPGEPHFFTPADLAAKVTPTTTTPETPQPQEKKVTGRRLGSENRMSWYSVPVFIEPSKVPHGGVKTWVPKTDPRVPELFEYAGIESNVKHWVTDQLLQGLIDGAEFRWKGRRTGTGQQLEIGVPRGIVGVEQTETPVQKIPYEVFVTLTQAQYHLLKASGFDIETQQPVEKDSSETSVEYTTDDWRGIVRNAVLEALK